MTLEQLIDQAMASGDWYGINIFAGQGDGARVSLLRNVSTAVADQCVDPAVPASERLRMMLERQLSPSPIANQFDDLLG